MDGDDNPVRRRAWLAALAGATTGLAGCGGSETPTDTPTRTATGTPDATATATETATDTATAEPSVVEFDGGGAAAFADALDTLRDIDGGTLRLAPGTYQFDASAAPEYDYPLDAFRVHFDGRDLSGATIAGPEPDAGTATVVLGDPTRGFLLFDDDDDVTVRDLTVRHDPPPLTQGTIRALDDGDRRITLALDDGYPTFDEPPFSAGDPAVAASVFTADGERVRRVTGDERGNYKRVASAERVGGRRYRLTLAEGVETGGLAVGRRLAVVARRQGAAGMAFRDCVRPTVRRVTLRSAPSFALWFVACDRPAVRDTTLDTGLDDRLVSVNADGVHCDNGPAGPRVEGCRFVRCGDDTVVADNELLVVDAVESERTVRVRTTFGTRVAGGDRLTVATPALEVRGTLPPVAEVDERGGGVTTDPVNPETVTFESAVEGTLSPGDLLTGPRLRNADTVVRDNVVRSIRARYVRVGGADGVLVADNEFVGTHSDGVEVEAVGGDAAGFPKGWSTDVTIRDNHIEHTGLVGVPSGVPRGVHVGVDAGERFPDTAASGRPHANVVVAGNEVTETAGPGVEVHDAVGVRIRDNRVTDPGRIPVVERGRYGVGLWNVADAAVTDTTVETATDDLNGFGWRRGATPTTRGNRYVVAGESRPATFDELG